MTKIKKIEGFNGYFVTDSGKVLSEYKGNFKWLKQIKDIHKYSYIHLYKDGKGSMKKVHRLVAEAFIHNPEGKPCIDHINGVRDDNRAENLRWCTQQENCSFPLARKRKSEALKGKSPSQEHRRKLSEALKGKPNLTLSKPVLQYTKDMVLVATYPSASEAERQTGCHHADISKCCNGKRNYAGGYKWRYAD